MHHENESVEENIGYLERTQKARLAPHVAPLLPISLLLEGRRAKSYRECIGILLTRLFPQECVSLTAVEEEIEQFSQSCSSCFCCSKAFGGNSTRSVFVNLSPIPETHKMELKNVQVVCSECSRICDLMALVNNSGKSVVDQCDDHGVEESLKHFLSTNQHDASEYFKLQQTISVVYAMYILCREIAWKPVCKYRSLRSLLARENKDATSLTFRRVC